MDEFKDQMSEFYSQLMEVKTTVGTPQYQSSLDHIWPLVRKETIDFGVMEGARDVVVFPVEIGWYDIGSWDSLNDLIPVDENGNISVGNHLALDTERTLVFGGDRLIATLGVEDLIIIDTEDALLVCSRDHEQDVKEIVARLKAEGEEGLL
jgi:mannose-1-phosphate guanylyltransferase